VDVRAPSAGVIVELFGQTDDVVEVGTPSSHSSEPPLEHYLDICVYAGIWCDTEYDDQ
jgi:hypothetical protein